MAGSANEHLIATKLRPPLPPSHLVERSRLAGILEVADADQVPMVLVCAPAGSGKSTLVAAWAAARPGPVAWIQLEELDSDPVRFWSALIGAIGHVDRAMADLLSPLAVSGGQAVVPALVNQLAGQSGRLVIVLDDYHLVDEAGVHLDVERLIDLAPPQLTVVVITRADPAFRLGRMRLRGRLREIRADDLRFESPEATELLGSAAAGLDRAGLEVLVERTEGWAAGLVLAGLSLERSADTTRFVESFHGDDQLVAGYLTDELLATLDPEDRRRMVEASVLHRLTGPLLDAVTGSSDGARWLDRLAADNQLVIRLDTVGEWYRYHHLFRDLLLLEAKRTFPERLADLHRGAAAWFETSGHPAAAVDHLLHAGEREQAMLLMRIVGPNLLGSGQLRTLRNILGRLSAGGELDAICLILSGWDHYLTGRYDTAQLFLDRAMATLPADLDPMRAMPLRINLALGKGDVATAVAGAREVVAAGDVEARPSELITATGAAFAWAGLVAEARTTLAVAALRTLEEQRSTAHAMALVAVAVAEFHAAGPGAAAVAAERALQFAERSGLGDYHGIAPALAIRLAVAGGDQGTATEADRAVALARRAATRLGEVFVLAVVGDVLVRSGEERGLVLIAEAVAAMGRCVDAGINHPLLARLSAKHRIATPPPATAGAGPVEALSERELAVLRYLPSALSLPQIARELYVSPNTVKTQCSAIYRKLAVSDRQGAVQAARELRLL